MSTDECIVLHSQGTGEMIDVEAPIYMRVTIEGERFRIRYKTICTSRKLVCR